MKIHYVAFAAIITFFTFEIVLYFLPMLIMLAIALYFTNKMVDKYDPQD